MACFALTGIHCTGVRAQGSVRTGNASTTNENAETSREGDFGVL